MIERLIATDMMRSIAWSGSSSSTDPPQTDKEICIREVVNQAHRSRESPGIDIKVGKLAKKFYLADHPEYVFPKKSIYANGQLISGVNMRTESQKSYIERALATINGTAS